MPNHIHGIINVVAGARSPCGDAPFALLAPQPASPFTRPARPYTKYQKSNNLSVIIGSYKSSVSRQINKLNNNGFKWQRSFHDHIIRASNQSLYNMRKYIINNPANWESDENNIKNYSVKGEAGLAPTASFDKIPWDKNKELFAK